MSYRSCALFLTAVTIAFAADELKLFKPLPEAMNSTRNPMTAAKVKLGRMLFYEPRLSTAGDISCNSCHSLDKYGVDGKRFSEGHKKQLGDRNSPTVYNAAGHHAQFWDGRAADVEEQAKGPVLNPVEMAMPGENVAISRLKAIASYRRLFQEAFPGEADPVTFDNMAKAIAAFERGLVTPARWDKYLKGDQAALTPAEIAGFQKFTAAGCAACHNGAYIGGTSFQKIGVTKPWPDARDKGRFKVTRQEKDKLSFKVPSLRNIAKTAPYFHDGSVNALDEAVRRMAAHQTGKNLSDAEIRSILTWFDSLTGELPAAYIQQPTLPAE
ncbi:MAG TPA: cytochrome-c peroxidase [Solibacterales bacterium]|nr:cytochrome-c peroxidase [Bryobacterales bacterium]